MNARDYRWGLIFVGLMLSGCPHGSRDASTRPSEAARVESGPGDRAKAGGPAAAAPASAPTSSPAGGKGGFVEFASAKAGVALKYPAAWRPRPNPDYELFLVPANAPKAVAATGPVTAPRSISLDVPDLPAHIPGLIPMGPTEKGYLDDLKKKVGQVKVDELPKPNLGGGQVKVVRSTTQGSAKPFEETAMIVIHNDHVYILRGTTDRPGDGEVRAAFEAMVKSWRWVKK